jgi:hypothetical protein
MGYIESNLLPDENIAYKARLHGIVFWKPVALTVLGIIFLVIQPIIGSIVVAIGLLALIPPFVNYTTSEFGATNKRVIIKVGLIRRRTLELLLRHVEAILVDQSVMGKNSQLRLGNVDGHGRREGNFRQYFQSPRVSQARSRRGSQGLACAWRAPVVTAALV